MHNPVCFFFFLTFSRLFVSTFGADIFFYAHQSWSPERYEISPTTHTHTTARFAAIIFIFLLLFTCPVLVLQVICSACSANSPTSSVFIRFILDFQSNQIKAELTCKTYKRHESSKKKTCDDFEDGVDATFLKIMPSTSEVDNFNASFIVLIAHHVRPASEANHTP